jgi:hypothetical protein
MIQIKPGDQSFVFMVSGDHGTDGGQLATQLFTGMGARFASTDAEPATLVQRRPIRNARNSC